MSSLVRSTLAVAALAAALALPSVSARAEDHVAFFAGSYDALDDGRTWMGGLEYRFGDIWHGLRPTLGASADEDSAAYAYGGVTWDIPLFDPLLLSPSFMVGGYSKGAGKDLGGALEFRSSVELSYRFANDDRLGVAFHHISNASLYEDNPGAESLLLVYQYRWW